MPGIGDLDEPPMEKIGEEMRRPPYSLARALLFLMSNNQ